MDDLPLPARGQSSLEPWDRCPPGPGEAGLGTGACARWPGAPLTVRPLHHHRVADGQQAPELLHHLLLPFQHGAHEPQASERELPVGIFGPEAGALLGARQAASGHVAARPPPSSAAGRPALTLRGAISSSEPGERPCFRLSSPGWLSVPRPLPPDVRLPGATWTNQARTRCPRQPRTPASALPFAQRRETRGHVSRGTSEGRPKPTTGCLGPQGPAAYAPSRLWCSGKCGLGRRPEKLGDFTKAPAAPTVRIMQPQTLAAGQARFCSAPWRRPTAPAPALAHCPGRHHCLPVARELRRGFAFLMGWGKPKEDDSLGTRGNAVKFTAGVCRQGPPTDRREQSTTLPLRHAAGLRISDVRIRGLWKAKERYSAREARGAARCGRSCVTTETVQPGNHERGPAASAGTAGGRPTLALDAACGCGSVALIWRERWGWG